jgi:hypothetical protein
MSPASYLTAPPRAVARSLALRRPPARRAILGLVLLPVWLALGISLALVTGSLVFAIVRAVSAWRTFRRFRRRVLDGQADLLRRMAGIERRMAASGETGVRLQRAQAELHDSLATARVLSAAVAEVRATVSRVTGLIPSK